jgi:hypothetical protein
MHSIGRTGSRYPGLIARATLAMLAACGAPQSRGSAVERCPVGAGMPPINELAPVARAMQRDDVEATVELAGAVVDATRAEAVALFHSGASGLAPAARYREYLDQRVFVEHPLLDVSATGFRFNRDFVLAIAAYALENGRRDLALRWLETVDPLDPLSRTFAACVPAEVDH